MAMTHPHKGFALLISIILTSVILAVGLALLNVAYKQILLSSGAKNSQYAFYNADSALECSLYWDQQMNSFDYSAPMTSGISCGPEFITVTRSDASASERVTEFTIPCSGGGSSATVTVYKRTDGSTNIYSNGYSTCDESNPNRIERGLKAKY